MIPFLIYTSMFRKFGKWLEDKLVTEGSNPGSKTGLYPLGYGGIGLYPPSWYPTRSADAIFYLSLDDRIYNAKEGKLKDLPGEVPKKMNRGEDGIWDITHLPGKPSHPSQKNYAAKYGDGEPWSIKHLKGSPKPHKGDFVPKQGEGGIWDITGV